MDFVGSVSSSAATWTNASTPPATDSSERLKTLLIQFSKFQTYLPEVVKPPIKEAIVLASLALTQRDQAGILQSTQNFEKMLKVVQQLLVQQATIRLTGMGYEDDSDKDEDTEVTDDLLADVRYARDRAMNENSVRRLLDILYAGPLGYDQKIKAMQQGDITDSLRAMLGLNLNL
ncbi:MAG TPA: hypothetical protein DD435_05270 [Cyanobacteria bacterium UBA8530]|nr:hypothetical protein [Cyanobacteria bacterium UBA8530]